MAHTSRLPVAERPKGQLPRERHEDADTASDTADLPRQGPTQIWIVEGGGADLQAACAARLPSPPTSSCSGVQRTPMGSRQLSSSQMVGETRTTCGRRAMERVRNEAVQCGAALAMRTAQWCWC